MQALLKLVYVDWRPVFLSQFLNPSACEPDYGRPSGHALTSAIMVIFTFFLMFKPTKKVLKVFLYVLSSVLVFFICFSRLYLGKHSVNQLVLGFCIGVFLYIILFYVCDHWIKESFLRPLIFNCLEEKNANKKNKIGLDKENDDEPKEVKSDKKILLPSKKKINDNSFQKVMIINLCLFIISNLFLIFGCIFAKIYVEFPDSDFFNAFKNCLELKSEYNSEFSSKIIRDGGLFNAFFGLVLAAYINHRKYLKSGKKNPSKSNSFKNPFQALQIIYDQKWKFVVIRVLCLLLCMLPLSLIFIIAGLLDGVSAVILNVSVGLFMPFLCGILLGTLYIFLLEKCNVPYYQRFMYEMVDKKVEVNND
jgi:hypothetical protein